MAQSVPSVAITTCFGSSSSKGGLVVTIAQCNPFKLSLTIIRQETDKSTISDNEYIRTLSDTDAAMFSTGLLHAMSTPRNGDV